MVQAAPDQHRSVSHWPEPSALVQSEALAGDCGGPRMTRNDALRIRVKELEKDGVLGGGENSRTVLLHLG